MRVMGLNVFAVLVAAIVIYAIEFVIFALLMTPEQYSAMVGLSMDQMHPERMPVGVISPILAAIGLALVIKWRNKPGWMAGAVVGLKMAVFFAFAASLYSYVYGSHNAQFLAVDLGHYLVCYAAAGAVLGAWK